MAPWAPQGPPFLVKMGWGRLMFCMLFPKCVRWSPSGRPKCPQGSPKEPPRPPQGHFLVTFGPLRVAFWMILTTFGHLFGHFFPAFKDFHRFLRSSVEFCVVSQIPNFFAEIPTLSSNSNTFSRLHCQNVPRCLEFA